MWHTIHVMLVLANYLLLKIITNRIQQNLSQKCVRKKSFSILPKIKSLVLKIELFFVKKNKNKWILDEKTLTILYNKYWIKGKRGVRLGLLFFSHEFKKFIL